MKKINNFQKFCESVLLNLIDNVDNHLISVIQNEVSPGGSVLEISCGNAADSSQLRKLGYVVKCTDLDDKYVENAKEMGLDCIKHDTRDKFPFQNSEFDLVYSRLGLHYFTEDELHQILQELKRIGKKLLITVKLVDDIKTGKVILTEEKWLSLVGEYFEIKSSEVKEGILYGSKTKWLEILAQ